jgi:hypothetical protein
MTVKTSGQYDEAALSAFASTAESRRRRGSDRHIDRGCAAAAASSFAAGSRGSEGISFITWKETVKR